MKYREVLRSNGKVRWGDANHSYARVKCCGVWLSNGTVKWSRVQVSNG